MSANYPPERVKLIFNPLAGRSSVAPTLLQEVIAALQALNYQPEVYLTQPDGDLKAVIAEALHRKIHLFVVCGGDGTIETVARLLLGKRAVLGLLPVGTQNNIALSLGIPTEIKEAAALLRHGQRSKIDVGRAQSGEKELPFLEVCSIGLFSALFSSADDLQHGNLSSLGEIVSTLTAFPLANIHLEMDKNQHVDVQGHVALAANLPYFGLNYRVTPPDSPFDENPASSWQDGVLDVLVFTDFSKLELVGNVLQATGEETADKRIHRYRTRQLEIHTDPSLPVLADSTPLGNTPVKVTIKHRALTVITGLPAQSQARLNFFRNLNLRHFFRH